MMAGRGAVAVYRDDWSCDGNAVSRAVKVEGRVRDVGDSTIKVVPRYVVCVCVCVCVGVRVLRRTGKPLRVTGIAD